MSVTLTDDEADALRILIGSEPSLQRQLHTIMQAQANQKQLAQEAQYRGQGQKVWDPFGNADPNKTQNRVPQGNPPSWANPAMIPGSSPIVPQQLRGPQQQQQQSSNPIRLAGDLINFPGYPGDEIARRLRIENMKNTIMERNPGASPEQINSAFDKALGFGGKGAEMLQLGPGNYQKWLDNQGMRPR